MPLLGNSRKAATRDGLGGAAPLGVVNETTVETIVSQNRSSKSLSSRPSSNLLKRLSLVSLTKTVEVEDELKSFLGLTTLFSPPEPRVEYIFIHGLGGGSIKTWCHEPDLSYFWPKEWLPEHPSFEHARIHSFGYNANWRSKNQSWTDISDFGQALLEALRNSEYFARNPIVFVTHSMGGLVAKETYLMAKQDSACEDIANRISAMVFLATPHRGSDYAGFLNKLLRISPTNSSRQYVSSLKRTSEALWRINNTFRHHCKGLILYSYYETDALSLGIGKSPNPIVARDSAVMGYPGERVSLLNADHTGMCKFSSRDDPNYVTLTGALAIINQELARRSKPEPHIVRAWDWFVLVLASLVGQDADKRRERRKRRRSRRRIGKPTKQ